GSRGHPAGWGLHTKDTTPRASPHLPPLASYGGCQGGQRSLAGIAGVVMDAGGEHTGEARWSAGFATPVRLRLIAALATDTGAGPCCAGCAMPVAAPTAGAVD